MWIIDTDVVRFNPSSHPHPRRRRLRQARQGHRQGAVALHVWQAQGQGRCHEGDQDGAYPEEGSDQGQAIDGTVSVGACSMYNMIVYYG